MNKFTVLISMSLATLFWVSSALADKPIKEMHQDKIHRHEGVKEIHKGKALHHQGVKELDQSQILRNIGQEKIKAGTELIQSGNKEAGKALIKEGTDNIHDANELHREAVHDMHQGRDIIYEGKKNIRDRDHN